MRVKTCVDNKIFKNLNMIDNHAYFEKDIMRDIVTAFRSSGLQPTLEQIKEINTCIASEYISERTWIV